MAQADTIVPAGVQGYDRYAYVNNNPVEYNDPSGHYVCEGTDTCTPGGGGGGGKQGSGGSALGTAWSYVANCGTNLGGCYMQGWSNFASAWSTINDPTAPALAQVYAVVYMVGWGGGHAAAVAGAAAIVIANMVPAAGGAAACATNGECTEGASTTVKQVMVLGRYDISPSYLEVANDVDGRVFSVPTEIWDTMSPAQKLAANIGALDQAISEHTQFFLSHGWSDANKGTGFRAELDYLFEKGFSLAPSQKWLIPPAGY
jgi:hypothetical protein